MSITKGIYEIETKNGLAELVHTTLSSNGFPILFVHGFGSHGDIWFKFKDSIGNIFKSEGFDVWTLSLSNPISGNLTDLAHEDLLTSINFIYQKKGKLRIIAHSMGGLILRYLLKDEVKHPYPVKKVIQMIEGVTMLATPNHGIKYQQMEQISNIMDKIMGIIPVDDEKLKSFPYFNQAYFQLIYSSGIIKSLNENGEVLNSSVRWQNGIAIHDNLVPIESAKFDPSEFPKNIRLIQEAFPCDHMAYPLTDKLMKSLSAFKDLKKFFSNHIYPPIHRYEPVAKWIIEDIE